MDAGSIGSYIAIGLALLRLIESIMVVMKADKALSIIKVLKEFFKIG